MTKRLLALVLVCILAIPIFAVPASATTYPIVIGNYAAATGDQDFDNWINLRNIANLLGNISDNVLQATNNYLRNIQSHIEVWSASWADTMSTMFDSIELMISWQEIQTEAQNAILGWNEDIWTALDAINTNFITFARVMETAHNNILDSLNAFWGNFIDFWEMWLDEITVFKTSVVNWFSNIWTTLDDFRANAIEYLRQLVNGSPEREQYANDFGESADEQFNEFFDNKEVIDEWTRPDYEADFDPSVEGITNGVDTGEYTEALYVFFDASAYLTTLLFMAFSFSVISFVVFGKR